MDELSKRLNSFLSRKFLVVIAFMVFLCINSYYNLGISENEIKSVALLMGSYIGAEGSKDILEMYTQNKSLINTSIEKLLNVLGEPQPSKAEDTGKK